MKWFNKESGQGSEPNQEAQKLEFAQAQLKAVGFSELDQAFDDGNETALQEHLEEQFESEASTIKAQNKNLRKEKKDLKQEVADLKEKSEGATTQVESYQEALKEAGFDTDPEKLKASLDQRVSNELEELCRQRGIDPDTKIDTEGDNGSEVPSTLEALSVYNSAH